MWPRFGPYHLARLEAAQRALARNIEIVGLETASLERLNDWEVADYPVGFTRVQAFPGRVFEDIPPREMERGITRALDEANPDAVAIMSYSYPDARAALSWCRRNHRAAILATDTKEDDAERIRWREAVKSAIVDEFDAALVSGTPQKRYLANLGFAPQNIFVGYNVVDNSFYFERAKGVREGRSKVLHLPGLDQDGPFFLSVNRLLPFKNVDGLLEAYAAYRSETDTPWGLLVVGDGPDRGRLECIVREGKIEGVVFCGYRQAEDIAAYYGRSSALIHPSRKDTWGLVVNEAMAAGLPVIVSDRVGCREDLVKDGENGYLFDPDDTERLTELMARMASAETDREAMSQRSLEIVSEFDLDRFVGGLHSAASVGVRRAGRPARPLAAAVLFALRFLSRRVTSFHTAEL